VTDLAVPATAPTTRRASATTAVVAGLLLGATTGVAARLWMRLVSAEPEFSWSGTVFIVAVFTLAGLLQGIALAVRRRGWRWWVQLPVRVVAGFGALLLGGGAGIVMLPAIVGGALATARSDWPRWGRAVAGTVAGVNAVAMLVVTGTGLPVWRLVVGWLAMLALYAVIIGGVALNLRPLPGRRRWARRTTVVVAAAAAAAGVGFLGMAIVGG
jgi:hypothetical protein